jgi:phosphoenolpyruvate synthase/pyruvate phosphate dikinase
MLEVPSLLWQLDELMEAVDFVSVGSNDLFQFMMAVDRGNSRVADRFDPLGRPFLRVLQQIVEAAGENEHPADAVWRDCRQAAFGHGIARDRFPLDLDVARGDRAGQVDAVVAGSGQT